MRSLALARYHVLSRVRSAHGLFVASCVLVVLPVFVSDVLPSVLIYEWEMMESQLHHRARNVTVAYFFHLVVMVAACEAFATRRASKEGSRPADLVDTSPIRPAERFFGDAFGIFSCAVVIHLCTLPLLALAVALSPLPLSVFFWLEVVVLAALVLASAAASWKLRGFGKWMRTRSARSATLFFILLLVVLISNTQWRAFRDAFLTQFLYPSPAGWTEIRAAILNPPIFVASLVLLYAGYILYFALSSIRALERGQEEVHAV